jgi:hypothetical protein
MSTPSLRERFAALKPLERLSVHAITATIIIVLGTSFHVSRHKQTNEGATFCKQKVAALDPATRPSAFDECVVDYHTQQSTR